MNLEPGNSQRPIAKRRAVPAAPIAADEATADDLTRLAVSREDPGIRRRNFAAHRIGARASLVCKFTGRSEYLLGSVMSRSIVLAAADLVELEPDPISPAWILSGTPEARNKVLMKSHDRTSSIVVWECTAGRFEWHYGEDETVVVISGEVFISTGNGEERRLGRGDMGFFPAGTSCTWRVPDRIKKIAILRKDLPFPLGLGVRAWHAFLRIAGLRGRSSLMPTVRH
jgi:uncharacterized protein